MKRYLLLMVGASMLITANAQAGDNNQLQGAPEGYKMVWNEEFDNAANLTRNWIAMDWPAGRVNKELQTYKPGDRSYTDRDGVDRKTLEIKDGKLLINLFEGKDGKIYSGRID